MGEQENTYKVHADVEINGVALRDGDTVKLSETAAEPFVAAGQLSLDKNEG